MENIIRKKATDNGIFRVFNIYTGKKVQKITLNFEKGLDLKVTS